MTQSSPSETERKKNRKTRPTLGSHVSIAGGVDKAPARAEEVGCDVAQIFTKSNNQWRAKTLSEEEVGVFRSEVERTGIWPIFAHDSYLINIGSPKPDLWKKSKDALLEELRRCELLGLPYLVMHPGSHTGAGEEAAYDSIARALDEIHAETSGEVSNICLENAAGQGTNIGHRFEHLAAILDRVKEPERVGICFDTCHTLAGGYDFRTEEGYEEMMREFDRLLGLDRLKCFHLNDSKKDLGCRVDRHEHIGEGFVGAKPFGFFLNDPRINDRPMVLETPKDDAGDFDRKNLALLRNLVK